VSVGDWTTNCVLKTEAWTLHFKPTKSIKASQGPRYLINLPVLSRQYRDDQIRHLDSYTELKTIASIDMPKIKIRFHEGDPLFNIKLDAVLNQTNSDKEVYASIYRDPEFINKLRDKMEYDVKNYLSLALATVSQIGIIYLHIKLRNLNMAIMVLQSQLTTLVKALDELQLTQRPKAGEPTLPNIHLTMLKISTMYWAYFIAIILVLTLARKVSQIIRRKCTE